MTPRARKIAPRMWLTRHAPVDSEGVCYGQSEVATTLNANDAARALLGGLEGGALGGKESAALAKAQVVWSSPLERCRAIGERLAAARAVEHRVDARLSELAFGAWEGRRWEALEQEQAEAFEQWMQNWQTLAPPGGESIADLERRVGQWYDELDTSLVHAIVTHAGVIRALRVRVSGMSWPDAMRVPVPHLQWTKLDPPKPRPDPAPKRR